MFSSFFLLFLILFGSHASGRSSGPDFFLKMSVLKWQPLAKMKPRQRLPLALGGLAAPGDRGRHQIEIAFELSQVAEHFVRKI